MGPGFSHISGPVPWSSRPLLRCAAGSGVGLGWEANSEGQAVGAQCAGQRVGSLLSPPRSAAVVNAISLYMRHLGVRTKSGDKKTGRNFFRKKVLP